MAAKIESLPDLRARISWIVLSAPDEFPTTGSFGSDQAKNLVAAFALLDDAFPLVEKKIGDPARLARLQQMLKDSLAAYQQGDDIKGAHLLQDFQNAVFPDRFNEYEASKGGE